MVMRLMLYGADCKVYDIQGVFLLTGSAPKIYKCQIFF